ncbi:MAG: NAD(P)-binding domain-containing protein [Ancrocorticia sp.]|uniref:NAD(P)-binding domain-containing protein n=1 Tax=Ancrocorticia sp. TaxID=2593684 RepID=UPI003F9375AF
MTAQVPTHAQSQRLPAGAWVPAERDGLPLWDAGRGRSVSRDSAVHEVDVLVIGAGQAGLAMAYELGRRGFSGYAPQEEFSGQRSSRGTYLVLDAENRPGGAWQHRWPSLTMGRVNHIADLPHFPAEKIEPSERASEWVTTYFGDFEDTFDLPIFRPVMVTGVFDDDGEAPAPHRLLTVSTTAGTFAAKVIVNCTGTWTRPFIPHYPGIGSFRGMQFHSQSFPGSRAFEGKRVVVVGGGLSALSHLDDLDHGAKKIRWATRTPPRWKNETLGGPGLSPEAGMGVEERVRARVEAGLAPLPVVAETGLPVTDFTQSLKERGLTKRWPMFSSIEVDGVRWDNGDFWQADAIVWATGFRPELRHFSSLGIRLSGGGILMDGTQVVADPRIHLIGYGPSASTVGARWASRKAAAGILTYLGS